MNREEKTYRIGQHIFLIGFMGAGKSTVAARLEELLFAKRVEMDQMIVEQQNMAISDIFAKYGEGYFRDLETKLLAGFREKEPMIISCGGGVVVRLENVSCMKECGRIVLLTAEPETIYERVKDSRERPILNDNMNVDFIRGLMEKRKSLYQAAADITVATDGKDVDSICREILEQMSAGEP